MRRQAVKKSKVIGRRIVVKKGRRYLVNVIDNGDNYIVKAHIADDENIPMFEEIHTETVEKQDLNAIFDKLQIREPVPFKMVGKKILKNKSRYYLAVVL